MAESDFQARLHDALNAPGRWTRVHRVQAGEWWALSPNGKRRYRMHGAHPGVADLVGFARPHGLYLEVECKAPKGRQRDSQKAREGVVKNGGGVYVLVREQDVEAAVAQVDEAIREVLAVRGVAC